MFHMNGAVERRLVPVAFERLGWTGAVTGPVSFGLVRFWACLQLNRAEHGRRRDRNLGAVPDRARLAALQSASADERPSADPLAHLVPPVALVGCLVVGTAKQAIERASWLAGYSRRAVLIPDCGSEIIGVQADAALLDQGVVVQLADGVEVLALGGPRVGGSVFDAREWELLERVYASYLNGEVVGANAG